MKPEEKRTTANLVGALNRLGIPANYENTGGGCMAGHLELFEEGLFIYFNDEVPDKLYDLQLEDRSTYDDERELWKAYDGGFDVNTNDGDNLFSATIGGCQNLGVIRTADDMAKEYVRILKGLGYERRVQPLPPAFQEALNEFMSAGHRLLYADWPDFVSVDTGRYPKYLPEFEEFLTDFHARVMGELD